MDIFFRKKYKYKLNEPIEEVKAELNAILNSRWHDFSHNMTGQIREDNSFIIEPKFSLAIEVFGNYQSFSFLEGNLQTENGRTIIRLTARPTFAVLFLLYFLLIAGIVQLITIIKKQFSFESILITILILVFYLGIYGVITFSRNKIRRRFERSMQMTAK
jgi:hypothetical protein